MDNSIDERADDINPFYIFTIVFTVLHLLVGVGLFVKQRHKFPVRGHNVVLTIMFGFAIASLPLLDAFAEYEQADTCTVSTIPLLTMTTVVVNFIAAQAIRLWYEYNYAEERVEAAQLQGNNGDEPQEPGWFTRNHNYFTPGALVGITAGVSLVELIIGVSVTASLDDMRFDAEVECSQMLVIIGVISTCAIATMIFIMFTFWRFRNKSDGYGIKKNLMRFAVVAHILIPPYVLIFIWEAFDDLPYYVGSFRVLIDLISFNLLLFVSIDWPVYMSFNESAQRGLSSISQEPDHSDGDDGDEVREVLQLAGSSGAADVVELDAQGSSARGKSAKMLPETAGAPSGQDENAPALFSSATMSLGLEEILTKPLYGAQLTSFIRHLIGEFNVEGLLFYLRVRSFQDFVKAGLGKKGHAEISDLSAASSEVNNVVVKAEDVEFDVEVAWKALLMYFEFLANGAPSQINIGFRVSESLISELEEAVVDFRQLPPTVPIDDIQLKRPIDTSVFDNAQHSVLLLLERDPFVRWRKAIRERFETLSAGEIKISAGDA